MKCKDWQMRCKHCTHFRWLFEKCGKHGFMAYAEEFALCGDSFSPKLYVRIITRIKNWIRRTK